MSELTAERLKELFCYDAESGTFSRIAYRRGPMKVGAINKLGYIRILVDGKLYLAHRLAWLYVTGSWPNHEIDHINGIRDDNRIANLRDVERMANNKNKGFDYVTNKTGFPGVILDVKSGKYHAHIFHSKTRIFLGSFDEPQQAHQAYAAAKQLSRTGRAPEHLNKREIKGFRICNHSGKFKSLISHAGKTYVLGYFDTEEEAQAAYAAAKQTIQLGGIPEHNTPNGYTQDKETGRFYANIVVDRKTYWLGSFGTAEEASQAYEDARIAIQRGGLPEKKGSQAKGYSFNKLAGKYMASITRNKKRIYLGLFDTAEEARDAYLEAERQMQQQ